MELFIYVVFIVLLILYYLYKFLKSSVYDTILDYIDIYRFLNKKEIKYAYKNQSRKSLNEMEENTLKQNFSYYNKLSKEKQMIFGYRVKQFFEDKKFEGMEGLEIDGKIMLLIAATAVKLTFGLRHYKFSYFHTFRIFPSQFYSKLINSYMHGGTSVTGVMSLAWDRFEYGFENTADNINLGFHEFAHALIISQQFDVSIISFKRYSAAYDVQVEYAKDIMKNDDFFRDYAYTNDMEFFAVVVEHFFENPIPLRDKLPTLYACLTKLLLQDPATITAT